MTGKNIVINEFLTTNFHRNMRRVNANYIKSKNVRMYRMIRIQVI